MERARKNILIDFFKGIGEVFNKIVNEGEVDDVELTGELAKNPEDAVKAFAESQQATPKRNPAVERVVQQSKAKTSRAPAPKQPKVIDTNDLDRKIFEDEELDK